MSNIMYTKAYDSTFWNEVRSSVAYKPFVDELMEKYKVHAAEPILADSFKLFDMFRACGNRNVFQAAYFHKRQRLVVSAMLSMIYPDEPAYLEMLEDIIWAICDEYTWSLPAHISWAEDERTDVDLFASETGYALSEIVTILKDRLNPRVHKRVCEEIQRRIIESFELRVYDWEKCTHNWAAVCAGSVSIIYMYMAPERYAAVKPRLQATMEGFLSGYSEDGICYEGIEYWEYGFGFFVAYAQRLYEFTGGKENYFAREKVHNIGAFQQMADLGGVAVSFADTAGDAHTASPAIYGVLQQHYDDIIVPDEKFYEIFDPCARWGRVFDAFVYLPETKKAESTDYERFSAEAGLYTRRTEKYGFAAKAGTNDEPHNHNDVGNFIFAAGGKQLLCDMGAGEYVSGYFAKETRYSFLCNCSRGHSVPIIDGKYQSYGAKYNGTMQLENDCVTIEFGNAYETDVRVVRAFTFEENGVVLNDAFEKQSGKVSVTERFVSMIKPEVKADGVWIENLRLTASAGWHVKVTEEGFSDHFAVQRAIYLIDFETEPENKLAFELKAEIL